MAMDEFDRAEMMIAAMASMGVPMVGRQRDPAPPGAASRCAAGVLALSSGDGRPRYCG
jgi:hypothetical protein